MSDPTPSHLDRLEPRTAEAAWWLVYAARVAGFPVVITSSARTLEEQRAYVAQGVSRTLASKHLEGKAFDIDWFGWDRDDVPPWFWNLIGPWAERELHLRWGGRWTQPFDPGHFEARW